MLETVLASYGIDIKQVFVKAHGSGLINNTWRISNDPGDLILQRINQQVFRIPENIADNIRLIGAYLNVHAPNYTFVSPIKTTTGDEMVIAGGDYYRLFPYVADSHTIDTVQTPDQAYEASRQFGLFTRHLSAFPVSELKTTIPDFHNLSYRFRQFEEACKKGNPERIVLAEDIIKYIRKATQILSIFENIPRDPDFRLRVTHHDTKISNVLFNKSDKGICVIDLDTVMPGYFISDVGDMMRTYLSSVSEEESDFDKIDIREDFFKAIYEGYMSEMSGELSLTEAGHFIYAGKFMIYMQAVRFLTDFLNNDIYYGAFYELHNYVRAGNQVSLLKKLIEKEDKLKTYS